MEQQFLINDNLKKEYEEALMYDLQDFVNNTYEEPVLLNRLKIYQPTEQDTKDNKMHILISYESDSLKEDAFFNSLQDFQPSGKYEIDWNPIEINKTGTIEDYLLQISSGINIDKNNQPVAYKDLTAKQQVAVMLDIGGYIEDEVPFAKTEQEHITLVHEHLCRNLKEISPIYLSKITDSNHKSKIDNQVENMILNIGGDIFGKQFNYEEFTDQYKELNKLINENNNRNINISKLLEANGMIMEDSVSNSKILRNKKTNKEIIVLDKNEVDTYLIDKTIGKIEKLSLLNKRKDLTIEEYKNRDKGFQENLEHLEEYAKKMKICGEAQQKIYETFEGIQNKNPLTKNILMLSKIITQLKPHQQKDVESLIIDKLNDFNKENTNYRVHTNKRSKSR